jgi:HK97 family phage major capsid protein/HK97 family phage prohead protease
VADDLEIRCVTSELRAAVSGETARLAGHAIVTNVLSEPLGDGAFTFRERIAPEAIQRALEASPTIVALHNHDSSRVLGRTPKTLRVQADDRGLGFELDMPAHAMDVFEAVQRGDAPNASFAFTDAKDSWDTTQTPPVRTLHSFRLREISVAVPFAAYPQTAVSTALRSLDQHRQTSTKEIATVETIAPPVVDPVPPVPPVVTDRTVPDNAEVRVLGRDDSFRSWVEERSKHPKEYGNLRLGDVLRALITGPRNELERRALSEGTDSAGGFSVPDILMAQWIDRLRNALVVVRAGAMTVPLTSDTVKIARLLADPTAAWRSENAAVAESEPTFEAVTFTPRSLDVFTKVSRELLEDSANISAMLEASLVRSFAVEVDRVCLYGTGTPPQPRGLRTTTGLGEVSQGTNGAALSSYDPIIDTLNQLWVDNVTTPTAAVMAPRTYTTIAKFKEATTNAPLAVPTVLQGLPFLMTANVPITETQGAASNASSIFIGDFTQMVLGFRTEMTVEVARELYRGNYQYGFFGHLRMDMQVTHPESFARLIGIIS